jgi:GT2 family glycosyltransferase
MSGQETVTARPRLSVVVASYNSAATLQLCLESLEGQVGPSDEIIVADCSDRDPREEFTRTFERVRFLRFEEKCSIPELRREALKLASGEILLLTEGRVVPSKFWAASLGEAHLTHPKAPAFGGPIDSNSTAAFDEAVFFCEYGLHMAPAPDGESGELSGANLSYKRWVLDLCRDLLEAGAWEPFWHRRLEEQGYRLRRVGAAGVVYRNSLSLGQFLRQRFHYGRWFAAERFRGGRRLLYAALCPVLPVLLTVRLGRLAVVRGRGGRYFRALPWIAVFQVVWAAGERVIGRFSRDDGSAA